MPYIVEDEKRDFALAVYEMPPIISPGRLNYIVTRLCQQYISEMGISYTSLNNAIGALECAKLELYRRLAAPYEDVKARNNGDVYEPLAEIFSKGGLPK